MASEKCSKCGAAFAHRDFFGWCTFECGTTLLFNGEVRWEGHECFTRQLAQSQAEVNELNNLLRAAGWGQGEIDNAAAVVDEVEAKLAKWDVAYSIIPPNRLLLLADWFDQDDSAKEAQANTMRGRGVQKDLRRLAAATEAAARAAKGEAT